MLRARGEDILLCCQKSSVFHKHLSQQMSGRQLLSCLVLCLAHLFIFADTSTESISADFGNHSLAWGSRAVRVDGSCGLQRLQLFPEPRKHCYKDSLLSTVERYCGSWP